MQKAADTLRAEGRKPCSWCHSEVPAGARTRCGKAECAEMIWRAYSFARCARIAMKVTGGKCLFCGLWADAVDHIIPVSLGGLGDQSNLRPLCKMHHDIATAALRRHGVEYLNINPFSTLVECAGTSN